jgi:tripartite-type tricarboxylate transporter receptor subunit TctC
VHKLSTEIARVLALPDIRDKLTSQGMDPRISTPEQFAALIKADTERYAKVIETANIKLME